MNARQLTPEKAFHSDAIQALRADLLISIQT
jgi:hypothetical protein